MIRFATPPQLTGCPTGGHGAAMRNDGWIDQSALLADPMDKSTVIQVLDGLILPTSGRYRCRRTIP